MPPRVEFDGIEHLDARNEGGVESDPRVRRMRVAGRTEAPGTGFRDVGGDWMRPDSVRVGWRRLDARGHRRFVGREHLDARGAPSVGGVAGI